MLIGHYAPALLIQRARPSVPLWALMVAGQFVDILWGAFVLADVEHVRMVPGKSASNDLDLYDMPFSHSALANLAWALGAFIVWRLVSKRPSRTGDAIAVAAGVASHFLLDLLVHIEDLPLAAAQGTKVGLGLWDHKALALTVETLFFAGAALAWWLPRRATPGARDAGLWLVAMIVVCVAFYFTPAPPTPALLALTGLGLYVTVPLLAAWAERRTALAPMAPPR